MTFFTTTLDVVARMGERGVTLRLDDQPRAITQVLREATNTVLKALLPLYDQAELQNDALGGGPDGTGGMVKDLATDLAVCRLAARRGNAVAVSFKDICKEAKEQLQALKDNVDQLPNVPMAVPSYPSWSNITCQFGYRYKVARVETQISDRPPRNGNAYTPNVDWTGVFWVEY